MMPANELSTELDPTAIQAPAESSLPPTAGAKVFLVDDNAGFRRSTRWLLEGHGYEVEDFATPRHFLSYLAAWPDEDIGCVLLDVRMPDMTGMEVLEDIRRKGNDTPVIFISGHGDVPLAVEAMRRGAAHFLEKPFGEVALVAAIKDAMARGKERVRVSLDSDPAVAQRLTSLTPRERQVLELVMEGTLNKLIADRLGISIKTVELHRSRIMEKMRAKSVAQLVQLTLRAR
jgi:two-component system, LuxR family, response regulator DctR